MKLSQNRRRRTQAVEVISHSKTLSLLDRNRELYIRNFVYDTKKSLGNYSKINFNDTFWMLVSMEVLIL